MTRVAWFALLHLGCVGAVLRDPSSRDPASNVAGTQPSGNVVLEVKWEASTMDLATRKPLPMVRMESQGVVPAFASTSNTTGAFRVTVPSFGSFVTIVSAQQARTDNVVFSGESLTTPLWLVTGSQIDALHVAAGVPRQAGLSTVIVSLVDQAGIAQSGISSVHLDDEARNELAGVAGPFYLGAGGVIDPSLTASAVVDGLALVAFLNVPSAKFGVHATTPGFFTFAPAPAPNSSMFVSVVTTDSVAPPATPTFDDVMTVLGKCISCHQPAGLSRSLDFTATPSVVHAALRSKAGVVNFANPGASLLLAKPYYEEPANHPQALFYSTNEPEFVTLVRWIQQGAKGP